MLEALFGSRTRCRLLSTLAGGHKPLGIRELIREVGTGASAVQREVERLESIGLLQSQRDGGRRLISLVEAHPFVSPIRELLQADAETELIGLPAEEIDPDTLARLNPTIRPMAGTIASICRRHGVVSAAVFGSGTELSADVRPHDLDLLVRFAPVATGYADRYFDLLEELEAIMGMPVDIVEDDAVSNPRLRTELDATRVVLFEAA